MSFFWSRKRLPHQGRYPMESIRRVDQTTTHIGAEIPRVSKRANFFNRARFGDLGPKAAQEVRRFVTKHPLAKALDVVAANQRLVQDGPVNLEKAPLPDDPQAITEHIKALCYFLDADIVGVCEAPEYAWYSHDFDGNPMPVRHRYAIVLLIDQGYETMAGSSGDDWISSSQSYRSYLKGSTIACIVADYIRQLGYPARAQTDQDSEVVQTPLVLLAGLGELSRIGEVVLNPFLGPRFKTAVVTTDLPLAPDKPIDFGLQKFCQVCKKCARECPCSAISFGDKVMFNGYEMWKPDVPACTRYRVSNPGGSSCGRCMKVCPYNQENLLHHRLALWLTIHVPALNRFLVWLDDRLQHGRREAAFKWWWDLEYRDGKLDRAEKVNERELRPERRPPPNHVIPIYTIETYPPPDWKEPFPILRRDGLVSDGAGADEENPAESGPVA